MTRSSLSSSSSHRLRTVQAVVVKRRPRSARRVSHSAPSAHMPASAAAVATNATERTPACTSSAASRRASCTEHCPAARAYSLQVAAVAAAVEVGVKIRRTLVCVCVLFGCRKGVWQRERVCVCACVRRIYQNKGASFSQLSCKKLLSHTHCISLSLSPDDQRLCHVVCQAAQRCSRQQCGQLHVVQRCGQQADTG
jgi:hypothetical protein